MSKIEVDQITQQSGTTVTVGGGACKTAAIDASTVTIGRSGGTVSLASGATQSGFGRTGTVNWDTTIKTADFTATSGSGFFVNTGGGSNITVTLPASPSAGDIVSVADYGGTAATNKIIINRNGSNLEGGTTNGEITANRQAVTLIFADSTQGWISVNDNDSGIQQQLYIAATGGNTTATCGDFKIHTFTSPGTFCVSCAGNAAGSNKVSYLVVAGGAGGGAGNGGGGGAGGFREGKAPAFDSYTSSPLVAPDGLTVTATGFPITVGGGGSGGAAVFGQGGTGSVSTFSTITSAGGGSGASNCTGVANAGGNGGSGGGGSSGTNSSSTAAAGSGNTPSVSPPQGQNGGTGFHSPGNHQVGGGGGGAGAVGASSPQSTTGVGGNGGNGVSTSINNSSTARGGGGGGGAHAGPSTTAGSGGSGGGGNGQLQSGTAATAGTANTGGGGGGGGNAPTTGAAGGSGIVIIRYRFQN
jgi:hypothetical protein